MKIDDLLCLCCLIFLILYILENIKLSDLKYDLIVTKNTSSKNKKVRSIKNFFDNFKNKRYNLYFPNTSNRVKISEKEQLYFNKVSSVIIHNLCLKLNSNTDLDFSLIDSINTIVTNYNGIYQLWVLFNLNSKKYKLKVKLVIIYVNTNEYYIVNLSLVDLIKKRVSNQLRKSKFYNKWII